MFSNLNQNFSDKSYCKNLKIYLRHDSPPAENEGGSWVIYSILIPVYFHIQIQKIQ